MNYLKIIENLKAENENLRREQDLMLLLVDLTLSAVEKWGRDHGLISPEQSADDGIGYRSDQVGMLLDQVGKSGKDSLGDRFTAIFKALEGSK